MVPLVEQLVHLLPLGDAMEPLFLLLLLLLLLPLLLVVVVGVRQAQHALVVPHVLEKLHHTFLGKVAGVQHTGLVEELLLHVQVVAPVASLQEGAVVVQARLHQASQRTQHDEQQEDGPAHRLGQQRRRRRTGGERQEKKCEWRMGEESKGGEEGRETKRRGRRRW